MYIVLETKLMGISHFLLIKQAFLALNEVSKTINMNNLDKNQSEIAIKNLKMNSFLKVNIYTPITHNCNQFNYIKILSNQILYKKYTFK